MKIEMRTGEFMLKGAAHAQSCAGEQALSWRRESGPGELEKLMEGTAQEAYGGEV